MTLMEKMQTYAGSFCLTLLAGCAFMIVDTRDLNEVIVALSLITASSLVSGFLYNSRAH